ncbi:MAG: hypothetical protein AAB013_05965, partial [Planctomycetota bacterium]
MKNCSNSSLLEPKKGSTCRWLISLSVLILATAGHTFSTATTIGVLRAELDSSDEALPWNEKIQTREAKRSEERI